MADSLALWTTPILNSLLPGSLRPLPTEHQFHVILDPGLFEILLGGTNVPPQAPVIFTVEDGNVTGCVLVLFEPLAPPVFTIMAPTSTASHLVPLHILVVFLAFIRLVQL